MENQPTSPRMTSNVEIALQKLLSDWGLIAIAREEEVADLAPLNQIKVLAYKDKSDWILEQKYNIGKKGKQQEGE